MGGLGMIAVVDCVNCSAVASHNNQRVARLQVRSYTPVVGSPEDTDPSVLSFDAASVLLMTSASSDPCLAVFL